MPRARLAIFFKQFVNGVIELCVSMSTYTSAANIVYISAITYMYIYVVFFSSVCCDKNGTVQ